MVASFFVTRVDTEIDKRFDAVSYSKLVDLLEDQGVEKFEKA